MASAMGRGRMYTQPAPAGRHPAPGLQAVPPLTGLLLEGEAAFPGLTPRGYDLPRRWGCAVVSRFWHSLSQGSESPLARRT